MSWSFTMHGPAEFYDVTAHRLPAKVRAARFVACISDFCRSQLMMLVEPDHWDKLAIVHMSVALDRYPFLGEQRQGRTGPLRVLFVGRLTPEKAPQLLVDAVRQLPPDSVAVRVVGTGPEQAALERQVSRLGLESVVQFVGALGQHELLEQYGWADVFCLPSFAEGVPVVLMEAMATGLPVVTTYIAGIPELVADGDNGVLITPGRADQVAQALSSVAANADLRQRFGVAGRAKVAEGFSPNGNAKLLKGLLDEHVQAPPNEWRAGARTAGPRQ
jgi:glycosyltransferase involved in cell wall biosynthesis